MSTIDPNQSIKLIKAVKEFNVGMGNSCRFSQFEGLQSIKTTYGPFKFRNV